MKRVFVSGPYSADTDEGVKQNVLRICEAIEKLVKNGFNPCLLILGHYAPFKLGYEEWMSLALDEVKTTDILLRIDGKSSGADREVALATSLGKKIYYNLDQLLKEEADSENHSKERTTHG